MCNYCGCRDFPLIAQLTVEHENIANAAGRLRRAITHGNADPVVRSARAHAERGALVAADAELAAALGLWRGSAFADVPHTATVAVKVGRLTEA